MNSFQLYRRKLGEHSDDNLVERNLLLEHVEICAIGIEKEEEEYVVVKILKTILKVPKLR